MLIVSHRLVRNCTLSSSEYDALKECVDLYNILYTELVELESKDTANQLITELIKQISSGKYNVEEI